ncbi:hypothetical protein WICMUC_003180 [Wickerhamomyces mucosus]|uniref:DUF962 domain-containing protein n=1 Tax=Wickerhamomyces mucosus TaxID=1378264 RepID=A0A9P8PNI5_9ASCO|nr:hypothetical protein WICMUC_003180 [Wickerhamomyces mucosus]
MSDLFNLEKQLAFYRSYHYNNINVLLHSIFIPTILFTATGILANIKLIPFEKLPLTLRPYHDYFNLGVLLFSIGYSTFYILLDQIAGLIALPILILFGYINTIALNTVENYNSYIVTLFLIGWVVQFIGHGVFERRAPALLDNLVQALVLAPYFVIFEALFLFGYRIDLHHKVDAIAVKKIEEFKANKISEVDFKVK